MKRKFIFILSFLVIMIGGVYINNTNNKLRTIDLRKKLLNETFQIDGNNNDLNNSPGLSNPFVVGVDKEKFNNENLYNPENEVTHVVKGVDYGMDGENSSDDTLAFYNALEYIKTLDGEFTKLVLPSGNLDFIQGMHPENPAYGIIIKDIDNLLIEGDNTTIYFHGEFLGVLIENSKNIYLREVNFDWGITPFSMGTIIENDGQVFKVKVHDGYNVDENTIVKGFLEYDKNAYIPRVKGNDIYGDVKKVKYLGDNTLEISFNNKHQVAPENTLVVLRHFIYEYDLIFVTNSKNTYFENINVYTSLGMGVRAYTSENLYFNRFNTPLKPGTDRLMTTTADAIHTIDVKGDLKVTNSLFENNGDDALNTHGAYLKIYNLVNNKTFRASNPRGYNFMPNIGDKIEINDEFEMGVVQTLTVENAVEVSNGYEITVTEELSSDVLVGALVGNITRTAKLYFGNNIVRNKRSRGILIQTRDVVVENNLFANIQDAGILIISDSNDWYESINSENVLIKNNKFLKNNYGLGGSPGDITILSFGKNNNLNPAGTQKDITIENNFIANSANSGIGISSAEDVVVKNNWISNVALLPKINTYNSAFYITNSSDLSFISNLVEGNSN
ncbi:MAG: right-handed parallel beta-helix repeat-containing protein, partial [Acholeplasmataceae bacterium]